MCDFANGKSPGFFIHPVIRSIMLHFWLAYDHPFVDGNGRTARALFYWSMLRYGFWLCEFISISEILHRAPAKYARSFIYTETDENDLTYFLIYQMDVLHRAIELLHSYIARTTQRLKDLEARLRGMARLNHRQKAIVTHALRHPHQLYTIASHQESQGVVYQTARADLLELVEHRLMRQFKIGRTWHFEPMGDLEQRLMATR